MDAVSGQGYYPSRANGTTQAFGSRMANLGKLGRFSTDQRRCLMADFPSRVNAGWLQYHRRGADAVDTSAGTESGTPRQHVANASRRPNSSASCPATDANRYLI